MKLVHRPLPQDDPRQRRPDISQAKAALDWRPVTPLEEGLAKTIAYFDGLLQADGVAKVIEQIAEPDAARKSAAA